jgi:hypothetical protein
LYYLPRFLREEVDSLETSYKFRRNPLLHQHLQKHSESIIIYKRAVMESIEFELAPEEHILPTKFLERKEESSNASVTKP